MRKRVLLAIWTLGILFPTAWMGRFSKGYSERFNTIFSPEWMHWVMHAGLYAGLAILILVIFDLRLALKALRCVLLIALGLGVLQESFRLLSNVQRLSLNSLYDLGIDLGGTLIG
jgi:hypothetical protein